MQTLNRPIEMVAQFNKDGSVRPICFRIEENDEQQVIYIKTLKHVDEEENYKQKIRKFACVVEVNGVQRNCEIIYDCMAMEWRLYRM